jgi:adenylate cyclase
MFGRRQGGTAPGRVSGALSIAFVLCLALGAAATWLADPVPLQSLRLTQFDQFQRWHPRPYQPAPVRVVDIDEASLKTHGQWPWPRTRQAELVDRLHAAGAAVIAFDLLLAEPDRTSPRSLARLWNNPQLDPLLRQLPDHDERLAQQLRGKNVVLGASLSRGRNPAEVAAAAATAGHPPAPYRVVRTGTGDPAQWLHSFDAAVRPLPVLAAAADGQGVLNFATDTDGVVRRVPMLLGLGADVVPSLSAEALRVAQGARNHLFRSLDSGIQDVRIGALTVPTNARAEIWLHYTESQPARYLSAGRVLSGDAPADLLDGHIVLIGSSAAGLMDLRFNPMGETMPGVEAHALALEQILTGQYLQRPAWAGATELVAMLAGILLVGLVAMRAPAGWAALVAGGVLAGLLGGAWYAFVAQSLILDGLVPALGVAVSYALAGGVHHLVTEREQRWVREAFSRYVSPNRVAHLVAHPEQLQLGGQRQVCSFVFTDLAGFTAMMESGDPARAVALLNDYLDGMLGIVFRYEGTLDRIVGDAVAVLFSAPVPQADHGQRALACALEMDRFATAYARTLQEQGMPWGLTRIGVHSGEVIVGNFGGKTLFDYRALGDPINTAARLESVNKHLGTRVCVSKAIHEQAPDEPVRPVGKLVLKGKTQPLQVYEPVAVTDPATCAPLPEYLAALRGLQPGADHNLAAARLAFEALAARYPADPLVALHHQRLQDGATDDTLVMSAK